MTTSRLPGPLCLFVPPYLLQQLADAAEDPGATSTCHSTLRLDEELRSRRREITRSATAAPLTPDEGRWTIHTADNTTTLPGDPVRSTGDPESGDPAVDEAYSSSEATLDLFGTVFNRRSYDGQGALVNETVHYGQDYDNAFWDGQQLVFGDGDGRYFNRFTKPMDVLAHEFTHAVTQFTAGLSYHDQPGALNESVSDAFASMAKQRSLGQTVDQADWLIGAGLFTDAVQGVALRSMKDPGTAYDDPRLGKDPQVGSMDDYVDTTDDNGGVHINSGIPNRAFYLAATAIGGHSWEQAGAVWYHALTGGSVTAETDFAGFARATIDAAASIGEQVRQAVAGAWQTVGVHPSTPAGSGGSDGTSGGPAQDGSDDLVAVRRSGGVTGISVTAQVDLTTDPRGPEISRLLHRIDFSAVRAGSPQPDRFVYVFEVAGREVRVPEPELTGDLARLADLLLGPTPDPE